MLQSIGTPRVFPHELPSCFLLIYHHGARYGAKLQEVLRLGNAPAPLEALGAVASQVWHMGML